MGQKSSQHIMYLVYVFRLAIVICFQVLIDVEVLPNEEMAVAPSHIGWYLPILLATVAFFKYDSEIRITDQPGDEIADEYDFIIVGAGSAGENNILFYYHIIMHVV